MLFEAQLHDFFNWLPWVRVRRQQRAMRAVIEQRRRMMSPEQVAKDSQRIMDQLELMSVFREAKTVMLYYPIHNEVDLRPLLSKYAGKKTFLLPVTHRRSMEPHIYDGEDMMRKGRYGIPEPQTEAYKGGIDLIIVPGVAFDLHCHRIGRGGGYFDKFISHHLRHHLHTKTIGVCYSYQLKSHSIPHSRLDMKVNRVVTPQQTIG